MISVSCGTEVMAEFEQKNIIKKEEKSIVFTSIRDSELFFLKLSILIFYQAIVILNPLLQRFQ